MKYITKFTEVEKDKTANIPELFVGVNSDRELIFLDINDKGNYFSISGDSVMAVKEDTAEEQTQERIIDFYEQEPPAELSYVLTDNADERLAEMIKEHYTYYAEDIAHESSDEYTNRLAEEMLDAGVISEEQAKDKEYDLDNDIDDFAEKLTDDAGDPYQYFVDSFGQEDANSTVINNGLLDLDKVAEQEDWRAWFDNSTLTDEVDYKGDTYLFEALGGGQNRDQLDNLIVSFVPEKILEQIKSNWDKYHLKVIPKKDYFPVIEQDRDEILEWYLEHGTMDSRSPLPEYKKGGIIGITRTEAESIMDTKLRKLHLDVTNWPEVFNSVFYSGEEGRLEETITIDPSETGPMELMFASIKQNITIVVGVGDKAGLVMIIAIDYEYTHPNGGSNGKRITYRWVENFKEEGWESYAKGGEITTDKEKYEYLKQVNKNCNEVLNSIAKKGYAKGGRVISIDRLAQKLERAYPDINMRENEDSISIFEHWPTDRNGDALINQNWWEFDPQEKKYKTGVIKHFYNFLDRNGYWVEFQNPEHVKIWKQDTYAKGGEVNPYFVRQSFDGEEEVYVDYTDKNGDKRKVYMEVNSPDDVERLLKERGAQSIEGMTLRDEMDETTYYKFLNEMDVDDFPRTSDSPVRTVEEDDGDEEGNIDDAMFGMDKWLPDDEDAIREFQDIEDKGDVEDMIEYLNSYSDEDRLYERYGLNSDAFPAMAKKIMKR